MISSSSPQLPDVGVIGLVPDRWSGPWQPRHHVLSRLGRYFHVVWMNPVPEWRRAWTRPWHWWGVERYPAPGLQVYSPDLLLPLFYRPRALAESLAKVRIRRARRALVKKGCRRIALYLWRPEFAMALDAVPHDASCYHIDDEYRFDDAEAPTSEAEHHLLDQVDQVFIHSSGLLQKKGSINPHTLFIPNGVDYKLYAGPLPEPADLASVPHPRIGYTGAIKKQLDLALIRRLADEHPAWSFVLVGPRLSHPEMDSPIQQLLKRANVYFLGAKNVTDLAAYPQHFDVCIMPYRVNAYTNFIYPMKLHEYLASGRPVVGSAIQSLEAFSEVVALARSAHEWSAALAEAIRPETDTPERKADRQAVAKQHDWDLLTAQIARALAGSLGNDVRDRLEERRTRGPA